MISRLPYYGLGVYLVAGIFYIMPSGLPQPADVFLLLTIAMAFVLWQRFPPAPAVYLTVYGLCTWILVVNSVWFAQIGDASFFIKTAFYLYNALVFIFVLVAAYRDWQTLAFVVRWACIIALFAQFAHVLFVPAYNDSGVRAVGTFHNPNQLGYWALLAMALLATAKDREPLGAIDMAAIAAGIYAILISLSKAALASGILMVLFLLAFQRMRLAHAVLMFAAAVLFVLFSQFQPGGPLEMLSELDLTQKVEHRVTTPQKDDNILNRGYKVIWDHPQYWAFGAGEAHYVARFKPTPKNSEVHSSLGNMFLSYGMVGLGIFTALLWLVFSRARWASVCYLIPIMAYSMVHMGLRVSEFWIFLALVYAQARWGPSAGVSHAVSSHPHGQRVLSNSDLGQDGDDHAQRGPGLRDGGSEGRRPVSGGQHVPGVSRAGPYWRKQWCDRS